VRTPAIDLAGYEADDGSGDFRAAYVELLKSSLRLGDELPSETFSNAMLLKKALRDIRGGDILMAHLGIWSRKDPWAPANLEPLIVGLKERGFCFETLRSHPSFKGWIAANGG
jgi:peptidoglycan/xylan/chitin deacetylase (PgdA/CDA1 family)